MRLLIFYIIALSLVWVNNPSKAILFQYGGNTGYEHAGLFNVYGIAEHVFIKSDWYTGVYGQANFSSASTYTLGARLGKAWNLTDRASVYVQYAQWVFSKTKHSYAQMVVGKEAHVNVKGYPLHSIINTYVNFGKGYTDMDYNGAYAEGTGNQIHIPTTYSHVKKLYADMWAGIRPLQKKYWENLEIATGPMWYEDGWGWQAGMFYKINQHNIAYSGGVSYSQGTQNDTTLKITFGITYTAGDNIGLLTIPRVTSMREISLQGETLVNLRSNPNNPPNGVAYVENYEELINAINNPNIGRIVIKHNIQLPHEFVVPYGKQISGKQSAGYTEDGLFIQYTFNEVNGYTQKIEANTPGLTMVLEGDNRIWGLELYNINIDNSKPKKITDSNKQAVYDIENNKFFNGSIAIINSDDQLNETVKIINNTFMFSTGTLTGIPVFLYRDIANGALTQSRAVLNLINIYVVAGNYNIIIRNNVLKTINTKVAYTFPLLALGGLQYNFSGNVNTFFDSVYMDGKDNNINALVYFLDYSPNQYIHLFGNVFVAGTHPKYLINIPEYKTNNDTIRSAGLFGMDIDPLYVGSVHLEELTQVFHSSSLATMEANIDITSLIIDKKHGAFNSLTIYFPSFDVSTLTIHNLTVFAMDTVSNAIFDFSGQTIDGNLIIESLDIASAPEFNSTPTKAIYSFANATVNERVQFSGATFPGGTLNAYVDISGMHVTSTGFVDIGVIKEYDKINNPNFEIMKINLSPNALMIESGGVFYLGDYYNGHTGVRATLDSTQQYTALQNHGLLNLNFTHTAQIAGTFKLFGLVGIYQADNNPWTTPNQFKTAINIANVNVSGTWDIGQVMITLNHNAFNANFNGLVIQNSVFQGGHIAMMTPQFYEDVPMNNFVKIVNSQFLKPVHDTENQYVVNISMPTYDLNGYYLSLYFLKPQNNGILYDLQGVTVDDKVIIDFVGSAQYNAFTLYSSIHADNVIAYGIDSHAGNTSSIHGGIRFPGLILDNTYRADITFKSLWRIGTAAITPILGENSIFMAGNVSLDAPSVVINNIVYMHANAVDPTKINVNLPSLLYISQLGALSTSNPYYIYLLGNGTVNMPSFSMFSIVTPANQNTALIGVDGAGKLQANINMYQNVDLTTRSNTRILTLNSGARVNINFNVDLNMTFKVDGSQFISTIGGNPIEGNIQLQFTGGGILEFQNPILTLPTIGGTNYDTQFTLDTRNITIQSNAFPIAYSISGLSTGGGTHSTSVSLMGDDILFKLDPLLAGVWEDGTATHFATLHIEGLLGDDVTIPTIGSYGILHLDDLGAHNLTVTTLGEQGQLIIDKDVNNLVIHNMPRFKNVTVGGIASSVTLSDQGDIDNHTSTATINISQAGQISIVDGHNIGAGGTGARINITIGEVLRDVTIGHINHFIRIDLQRLGLAGNLSIQGAERNVMNTIDNPAVYIGDLITGYDILNSDIIYFSSSFNSVMVINHMDLHTITNPAPFGVFGFSGNVISTGHIILGGAGQTLVLFDNTPAAGFNAGGGNNYLMRVAGTTNISGLTLSIRQNGIFKYYRNGNPTVISQNGTNFRNTLTADRVDFFGAGATKIPNIDTQ